MLRQRFMTAGAIERHGAFHHAVSAVFGVSGGRQFEPVGSELPDQAVLPNGDPTAANGIAVVFPVGQHISIAFAAAGGVFMACRAVGMAVNDNGCTRLFE